MNKYEFGVMSRVWKLEAESDDIAEKAMAIFIGQNIPIVIYKPFKLAFMPKDVLPKLINEDIVLDLQIAIQTIKEVR